MTQHPLRVLAVEPDPGCREHLRNLLARQAGVSVELVATADAAAAAMHANPPDLILTSTVLPPRAEEQVIDALKHLDPDGNVPMITVPPLLEAPGKSDGGRSLFTLIGRRKTTRPSYDAAAVVARIEEALRQVREAKDSPRVDAVRVAPAAAMILRPAANTGLALSALSSVNAPSGPLLLQRQRLERAPRVNPSDLPSRCTLTTPSGFIVRMLNVSESGVLFESPLKFTRDSETSLSLFSPQGSLVLPARIVRSDVATVNGLGVTYQTAAQFSEALDLVRQVAPEPLFDPAALPAEIVTAAPSLADLLVRITTELYQHQRGDAARAAFEAGLRQLVPACDIRLCDRLVNRTDAGDSIYFAVPGASGVMVQATFDAGHQPTAEDFKLLRAAAAMASVIVHGETHSLLVRRTA